MEGDIFRFLHFIKNILFQSTPSAWRVTLFHLPHRLCLVISIHTLRVEGDHIQIAARCIILISIHTLRVEGDWQFPDGHGALPISIHTLRVEGDNDFVMAVLLQSIFQSTPSAWRVTGPTGPQGPQGPISIHTLRVEGDPPRPGRPTS